MTTIIETVIGEKAKLGEGRLAARKVRKHDTGVETILVDMAALVKLAEARGHSAQPSTDASGLSKGATDHPIIYPFYLVLAESRRLC